MAADQSLPREVLGESSVQKLPSVTVTASRIAADDIDTDYQTSSVTVISYKDFDTKVATVADVLRKESGVQIRQIGGLGSSSRVNIRGSSARQVNVFLDGVLLNGAFGGSVDLSQFSLGNIEQIEIYRGNAPVQLAYSGIGGAINIKTRKLGGKPQKQLVVGVGSFESKKVAASLADSYEGSDFFISGEYLVADNDFDMINYAGTPDNRDDDFIEKRNNADFDHTSGLLSWSRSINKTLDLKVVTQYFEKNDRLADPLNKPTNTAELATSYISGQVKLDYFYSPVTTYGFKLFSSEKIEAYQDPDNIGLRVNDEEGGTRTYGLSFQASHTLQSNLVSLNLENTLERYKLEDFIRNTTVAYKRNQSVLGIQNEWISPQGDWLVNLGGRVFHVEDVKKLGDTSNTQWHSGLHFGVLYTLSDTLQLRTNVSHNIRIPQLFELYGDRGFFIGNDELVPETALNLDVGVSFNSQTLSVSTSAFYRDLDDAIVNTFSSQGVGQAKNNAEAIVKGLELDAQYQITAPWSVSLKSTLQDSENHSKGNDLNGNQLAGLYSFSNFIDTSIALDSMIYSLEFRHQSGGFYDESNDAAIPDQDLVNISVKWQILDSSFEARVDNLGDKFVEDFHRYPMPGRHFFIVYKQIF